MHFGFFLIAHEQRKSMIIRTITYTNFDDEEVTKSYAFHLSKTDLVELEVSEQEGFKEMIENIVKTNDRKALVEQFKRIVLMAYGVREGDRFIKNDQLREEFSQTPAYEALFMELATQEGKAVEFLTGCLPKDMRGDIPKAMSSVPAGGPLPPTPPTPPSS
jgi:hypothetical protein